MLPGIAGLVGRAGATSVTTTAWRYPTAATSVGSGQPWSGEGNVSTAGYSGMGDSYDYARAYANAPTQTLRASGFGFSIPTHATDIFVQVGIDRLSDQEDAVRETIVRLWRANAIGANRASATLWNRTKMEVFYGGPLDNWGAALTPAIVNATNFGVDLAVEPGLIDYGYASVDAIRMRLTYTA